jgi:hypothetical protein
MEKRHEIWHVECEEPLTAAARDLARYKLDLVGVQEVRWGQRSTVRAGCYNFSMEKETKIVNWEQDFL